MRKQRELSRKQTRAMREFSILFSTLPESQSKAAESIFTKMDEVNEGLKQPGVQRMDGKQKISLAIIIIGFAILAFFANVPPQ
jgi:hypothetical protein